ncbi:hypothetical protein RF11_10862 [Thelohanellus kitauei]|uniref:Uncharacterized protein n=1 Tax=Thelohanellus kitauei TaxID=669202 RepID=A0A0C2IZM4_THEKT|nr:hypothetical protein RF11_10862 [Thelohanellus kitauei]
MIDDNFLCTEDIKRVTGCGNLFEVEPKEKYQNDLLRDFDECLEFFEAYIENLDVVIMNADVVDLVIEENYDPILKQTEFGWISALYFELKSTAILILPSFSLPVEYLLLNKKIEKYLKFRNFVVGVKTPEYQTRLEICDHARYFITTICHLVLLERELDPHMTNKVFRERDYSNYNALWKYRLALNRMNQSKTSTT